MNIVCRVFRMQAPKLIMDTLNDNEEGFVIGHMVSCKGCNEKYIAFAEAFKAFNA